MPYQTACHPSICPSVRLFWRDQDSSVWTFVLGIHKHELSLLLALVSSTPPRRASVLDREAWMELADAQTIKHFQA